jgi:hypothetical protein
MKNTAVEIKASAEDIQWIVSRFLDDLISTKLKLRACQRAAEAHPDMNEVADSILSDPHSTSLRQDCDKLRKRVIKAVVDGDMRELFGLLGTLSGELDQE